MNLKLPLMLGKLFGCVVMLLLCFSCKKEVEKTTVTNVKQDRVKKVEPVKTIPISTQETELLKKLINREIADTTEGEPSINLKEYPYSVHFYVEGDSHTVYFSIEASDDFNDDGVTDYIVSRISEGMLGGNVNSNSHFIFIIMKDENIIAEEHSVLTYAPFSYNILDEPKYKAKKFKITAVKNFRTYMSDDEASANLVFVYRDGNLYEASYLSKCKLAELENKIIFKPIANVTKRFRSIEMHNYTETIEETYQSKDTIIHAGLSGCDNPNLEFDIVIPATENQIHDVGFIKNATVALLRFLAAKTQFEWDINPVIQYYYDNKVTDEEIVTDDNLVFRVFVRKEDYDKKEKRLSININIERRNNPNQIENWEITTRKQAL